MDSSIDSTLSNSLSGVVQYQSISDPTSLEINQTLINSNSDNISWRDRSGHIRSNHPAEDTDGLLYQFNSLSFEQLHSHENVFSNHVSFDSGRESSLFSISDSSSSNNTNLLDNAEPLPAPPRLDDSNEDNEEKKEDDDYSELGNLNPTCLTTPDLTPEDCGLPSDFDKQALYKFINNENKKVICDDCNKKISLLKSFYDPIKEIYLCIPCAAKKSKEEVKHFSWEDEEKGPVPGFRKCKRIAHFKPLWSFLARDKQKSDDKKGKPLNLNLLKIENQCFYCRNYKSLEYLKKKNDKKAKKRRNGDSD